jgi:hypothetical protein
MVAELLFCLLLLHSAQVRASVTLSMSIFIHIVGIEGQLCLVVRINHETAIINSIKTPFCYTKTQPHVFLVILVIIPSIRQKCSLKTTDPYSTTPFMFKPPLRRLTLRKYINIPPSLLLLACSALASLRCAQQIIDTACSTHARTRPRWRTGRRTEAWSR